MAMISPVCASVGLDGSKSKELFEHAKSMALCTSPSQNQADHILLHTDHLSFVQSQQGAIGLVIVMFQCLSFVIESGVVLLCVLWGLFQKSGADRNGCECLS